MNVFSLQFFVCGSENNFDIVGYCVSEMRKLINMHFVTLNIGSNEIFVFFSQREITCNSDLIGNLPIYKFYLYMIGKIF